jgi:hypothetical protein
MTRWEYCIVPWDGEHVIHPLDPPYTGVTMELNKMGAQGWELVAVRMIRNEGNDGTVCGIWKRPVHA